MKSYDLNIPTRYRGENLDIMFYGFFVGIFELFLFGGCYKFISHTRVGCSDGEVAICHMQRITVSMGICNFKEKKRGGRNNAL